MLPSEGGRKPSRQSSPRWSSVNCRTWSMQKSHQHDTPTTPRQSKMFISPRMQQARLSSRVQDEASYSLPSIISDIRAFRLYDKDVATFKLAQSNHKVRIKIVAKIAVSGCAHVSENDDRGPHVARANTPDENVQELHRSWEHAIVAT